jgi:hypothetical protein
MLTTATPTNGLVSVLDAASFAADAERITNNALLDEWIALYRDDAIVEWIMDGASQRHEGITAISRAAAVLAGVWRDHRLHVRKTVECADADTIVLSWRGGFRGRGRQFGTEIFTMKDGRIARHQMYAYLDVRPSTSVLGMLRVAISAPRIATSYLRNQLRHAVSIKRLPSKEERACRPPLHS